MRFKEVSEIERKMGRKLPSVLRTLLVSDGTVTRFLEAYYGEEIQVQVQKHQKERLNSDLKFDLKLSVDESVLIREVELRGRSSQKSYVTARSWVRLPLLDQEIQKAFQQKQWGIGELLSDRRVESYREILGYWIEGRQTDKIVGRAYRIWIRSEPTILIEERFLIEQYFNKRNSSI